ncbi:MAG: MMPL family transporter [Chloroflexi bacterium]|nr:MMPL family transporter [Chloroflexota bacterium]
MAISATLLSDALTSEFKILNNADSVQADNLLEDRLDRARSANEVVIVRSDTLTVDDEAFQQTVEGLFSAITGLGEEIVAGGVTYYISGNEELVSEDRRTTIIPFTMTGSLGDAGRHIEEVRTIVDKAFPAGFEVLMTGEATIGLDFQEISQEDLEAGESIGIPLALIILVIVFGTVVAAVVPVIVAVVSIAIAFGITALVGQTMELSFFVTNIIVMIGLPVGIDYSLFIVHRFRDERARGLEKMDAIAHAGSTASRAVFFSGITVILALTGMLIIPHNVFRSLGAGAIAVVTVSILASLTLLPAVLSILGDKVNRLSLPFMRHSGPASDSSSGGFWNAISHAVMRRPLISMVLATGVLLALAAPYLRCRRRRQFSRQTEIQAGVPPPGPGVPRPAA